MSPIIMMHIVALILYLIPTICIIVKKPFSNIKPVFLRILILLLALVTAVFMIVPVGIKEFGYSSAEGFILWLTLTFFAYIAYWILIVKLLHNKSNPTLNAFICGIPCFIALLTGLVNSCIALVAASFLLAACTMLLWYKNLPAHS